MVSQTSTQSFHKTWLLVSALVIGVFGPALTLASIAGYEGLAVLGLDILSWPVDGSITYANQEMRFLSALAGGVLVGWGVMVWCLRQWVYDLAPEGVRKSVVVGTLFWFVFDSFGSIASGTTPNAFFNVLVLLAVVGPMWRPSNA